MPRALAAFQHCSCVVVHHAAVWLISVTVTVLSLKPVETTAILPLVNNRRSIPTGPSPTSTNPTNTVEVTGEANLLTAKFVGIPDQLLVGKLLGAEHVQVGVSKRILGKLYQDKGKFSEAENYYTGAVETFKKVLPEGHARTAGTLHLLGELYLRSERSLKAEQPLREALDMRKKIFGKNDKRTVDSMIKLGVCLAKNGEAGESKSLLRSGLEILDNFENESGALRSLADQTLARL